MKNTRNAKVATKRLVSEKLAKKKTYMLGERHCQRKKNSHRKKNEEHKRHNKSKTGEEEEET